MKKAGLIAVLLLIAFGSLRADDSNRTAKTLRRSADLVVVNGARAASVCGTPVERLGLYVYDGARLLPVPVQFDQREKGEYVFQSGPAASPKFGRGALDADDEIAFMAGDTGPRISLWQRPNGVEKAVELIVRDPLDGSEGYLYMLAFSQAASRSPVDYVVYHPERNEIETTDYLVGYGPEAPISISKLLVKPAAGGSGQSVADRQKIRVEGISIWNLLRFTRTENDFHSDLVAYTDGPVRVLRKTKTWLALFWRIPSPSVQLTSMYWKTGMSFPLQLDVPFNVSHFFREARLRMYVDTPPQVLGRKFYNQNNRQGLAIDGRMEESEKQLDRRPSPWQVVAGTTAEHPEGWFSRQIYNAKKVGVTLPVYYLDDQSIPDPPERFSGCFGCLGFEMDGLEALQAGSFSLTVQMMPMRSYKPGEERDFLSRTDHPLVTTARELPN